MGLGSLTWYRKMYEWFKKLPVIQFFVSIGFGVIMGIADAIEEFSDLEIAGLIVWPLVFAIGGGINYVVTSIILSPVIMRTSAAIGEYSDASYNVPTPAPTPAPAPAAYPRPAYAPAQAPVARPAATAPVAAPAYTPAPEASGATATGSVIMQCTCCGKKMSVSAQIVGKKIKCPFCRETTDVIPASAE